MKILWKDIEIEDELIIPSNSNLKYLKVLRRNQNSFACSMQGNKGSAGFGTLQEDTTKHDGKYYLQDDHNYRDIWLAKRNHGKY